MSYLSRNKAISRSNRARGRLATNQFQPDYNYNQTSIRRHEVMIQHQASSSALAGGDYIPITMLRFKRTFDPANADVPPTPTAGNNYQSVDVFNGSKVQNYQSKIFITNTEESSGSSSLIKSFYLDIYQVLLSFYDGNTWEDFAPGATQPALTDFDGSTVPSNHDAGEVDWVSPNVTLSANAVKNNKFTQRFMRLIGRIQVPQGQTVSLNINRVPPKARRSNSGMFWGIALHNESSLNNANSIGVNVAQEVSFEEVPSEIRLPFVY